MSDDSVLCPDCGWTGSPTKLDDGGDDRSCPLCSTDIEIID
ncbi:hypothetical protein [Salinigranum marinum]|jgi:rubredoxin|nr:hypothetical protein [Salinigranum marinum]